MNKRPLVSIVMATFNRAHLITATIENILEQDYRPFELIIINDGSTDSTTKVLTQFQQIVHFKLINNETNIGLQKSLNKGLQIATGKYIARIDDHDKWIDKSKITKQVDFLEKNKNIGIVGTAFMSGGKKTLNPLSDIKIRKQILFRSPFCHVSVLFRKAILEKVKGYDETLSYSEDWDLWLRMGQHTQFANLPEVAVSIFEEEESLSNKYFVEQLPLNYYLIKKYWNDYPNKTKAKLYHFGLKWFFAIFPRGSVLHRMMQRVFRFVFLQKN